MKKSAFTLSELLIALSIVGVIAILTIPKVANDIFRRADVAKVQATYKEITDAVKVMMVTERTSKLTDTSIFDTTSNDRYDDFYTKYLKVVKRYTDSEELFADTYFDYSSEELSSEYANDYINNISSISNPYVSLPNGASVLVDTTDSQYAVFLIDINGIQKPNMAGVDLFSFKLGSDGDIVLPGYDDTEPIDNCKNDGNTTDCFSALMYSDWDPNYLN